MSEANTKRFDVVGFIMDWECGDLTADEVIEGFQHLIDNGMAWTLQGCYGRNAASLIKGGHCIDTHNRLGGNN